MGNWAELKTESDLCHRALVVTILCLINSAEASSIWVYNGHFLSHYLLENFWQIRRQADHPSTLRSSKENTSTTWPKKWTVKTTSTMKEQHKQKSLVHSRNTPLCCHPLRKASTQQKEKNPQTWNFMFCMWVEQEIISYSMYQVWVLHIKTTTDIFSSILKWLNWRKYFPNLEWIS